MLSDATKDKKMDIRVLEKNLSRGVISAEEAQAAVKKLKDDADNAIWVNVEELPEK